MRRVLVTGATGFIGRHALPSLISRGFEVIAVSSRPNRKDALPQCPTLGEEPLSAIPVQTDEDYQRSVRDIRWVQADLLDTEQAAHLVAVIRPTHLLHLGWTYAEPGKFWNAPENFSWVQTSIALLEAFARNGGRRVVSAGTCAEYDWSFGLCTEDHTPLNPRSPYGVCKHAIQAWQSALATRSGCSSAWGRAFLMYGPGEHRCRLVASVITSLLTGKPARCTDGKQVRDLMHVHDVADAFVALLDSEVEGAVNIASGVPVVLRNLVTRIAEILGAPGLVDFGALESPTHDPPRILASTSRLEFEVGFRAHYDLENGLAQTINWWKGHCALHHP